MARPRLRRVATLMDAHQAVGLGVAQAPPRMSTHPTVLRSALLCALCLLAAGCPDTQEPPNVPVDGGLSDAGEPDAGDPCTTLTLGAQHIHTNLFGQITGVRVDVAEGFDAPVPESLMVELYDSTTPNLPPLEPGTFALGEAPNDNLSTCQHCVWLPLDWDGMSPLGSLFIATEGSVTLLEVSDPLDSIFTGALSDVVLREATIDPDTGKSALVADGRCLRVPQATFDTSPSPGRDCLSAEQCGNPLLESCSPATYTCAPHECGSEGGCPQERPVCLTQYGNQNLGACYAFCDPTLSGGSGTCATDESCVQMGVHAADGLCLRNGPGALGDACTVHDTSTSCQPGMLCSQSSGTCTRSCTFFSDAPGCQSGHVCSVLGVCEPQSVGVDVQVGEPCGDGATLAQGCASDGAAFRGICFAYEPAPLICEEACLGDQGCDAGEFCAMRFSSGLGVCRPIPVCGDGEVGEINETCDDGNTTSGDGCSGDCQTVEYAFICSGAPLLADGDVEGDTSSAWDGFHATCQLGTARADVYQFDPPSRGRLELTLTSATTHIMSLRTSCEDAGTEFACDGTDFTGTRKLVHQVTAAGELSVVISAYNVLEQGPYTLTTSFVPEACGDGVVAGLEVCDDGNTQSNDGCRSDCAVIEYAHYCDNATPLTASAAGDNTTAPSLYQTSCTGSVFGSGQDRLYEYTAPSAGTVRFTLEPDVATEPDLVLAVFDGCGEPAAMNELGCSAVYGVEQVEVAVTAGQTLTVLVEGFHPHSVGTYTLSAQMLP